MHVDEGAIVLPGRIAEIKQGNQAKSMTQTKLRFSAYILSMTASIPLASRAGTLCTTDEKVVFSCVVSPGKTVSFCQSSRDDLLVYRFGMPKLIELEYKGRAGESSDFFYGVTNVRSLHASSIGLLRGKYQYEAYRELETTDRRGVSYSLIVTTPNGTSIKACLRDVQDVALDAVRDIPCDRENVHGCAVTQ